MGTFASRSGGFPRTRIAVLTLAAALGLGVAGIATAAPHHGSHGHHHLYRGIAKLHANLKLNAEQEALWQSAKANMKQVAQEARTRRAELRSNARAALEQPNADLRQLLDQADRARDQGLAARRQARSQWLALYDSLDAGQKEQVRVYLKGRLDKSEKFSARMKERREARREAAPKSGK